MPGCGRATRVPERRGGNRENQGSGVWALISHFPLSHLDGSGAPALALYGSHRTASCLLKGSCSATAPSSSLAPPAGSHSHWKTPTMLTSVGLAWDCRLSRRTSSPAAAGPSGRAGSARLKVSISPSATFAASENKPAVWPASLASSSSMGRTTRDEPTKDAWRGGLKRVGTNCTLSLE